MKIYRLANIEKSIKWECPDTGISIVAHFIGQDLMNGYELYCKDGSFVDVFDNFWHARNWAKKHLDRNCNIPTKGEKID